MKPSCTHAAVSCLNTYELIRKYRCDDCGGVMMCACDEAHGRRFLPHQLASAQELATRARIPVDLGFLAGICTECRGQPAVAAPLAEGFGRTSKIKRYYWRELHFLSTQRTAEWAAAHLHATEEDRKRASAVIGQEVLDQVKAQHAASPKYSFGEPSQSEILARCKVDVQRLDAAYSDQPAKGAVILHNGVAISPEDHVSGPYEQQGWSVMKLESRPLHALFGVMMWMLIQDPTDPKVRIVGFGDRRIYEASGIYSPIWTGLPEDFGTKGYAVRRAEAIEAHLASLPTEPSDLLWHFDFWRPYSVDLRHYLWAHRDDDVDRARQLIEWLSTEQIVSTLRYLVEAYWGRYLGWPDLLMERHGQHLFGEVKSSGDRLSQDQKRWIIDNHERLGFPYRLIKVHRKTD